MDFLPGDVLRKDAMLFAYQDCPTTNVITGADSNLAEVMELSEQECDYV